MKITIEISTDNAAFQEAGVGYEVARILRVAANQINEWRGYDGMGFPLRDANGNKVGKLEALRDE